MEDELSFNDLEFSHIQSFVHANQDRTKSVRYGLDTNNVSYFTVFSANMFKNSLETIDHDDRLMSDLAYYMRTVWEHVVSHY
eukprot:gene29972-37115_t